MVIQLTVVEGNCAKMRKFKTKTNTRMYDHFCSERAGEQFYGLSV